MNVHTEPLSENSAHKALYEAAPKSAEFNKLRKRLIRQMQTAMDDFSMVAPGERWLVGLSPF